MKYKKFEGTLGEFAESYINGDKFYHMDCGYAYEIPRGIMATDLKGYHGHVYFEDEPKWYEDLGKGVLCRVCDEEDEEDGNVAIITGYDYDGEHCSYESRDMRWQCAIPMTKDEVMEYIYEEKK